MIFRGDERSGAYFNDETKTHRYLLWRAISDEEITKRGGTPQEGCMLWCGLNPSTADEAVSDPTCTREIRHTARFGFRKYLKWNVFAIRSTDPRGIRSALDAFGPENMSALDLALSYRPAWTVAAWGPKARHKAGDIVALSKLELDPRCGVDRLRCLRVTKDGYPQHPLYLRSDSRLLPYSRIVMEQAAAAQRYAAQWLPR